jgi:F420-dependent methylenetetrahydromethanopterin dehydrogenase
MRLRESSSEFDKDIDQLSSAEELAKLKESVEATARPVEKLRDGVVKLPYDLNGEQWDFVLYKVE